MEQISVNVYIEDKFSVPPPPNNRGANFGFVTTSEGIVLIDPPFLPTDALKWRDKIAEKGEVRYIINTEQHIDHIAGNFFFPGTVVSHEEVKKLFSGPVKDVVGSERIDEVLKGGLDIIGYYRLLVGERDPEGLPLLEKYQLRAPTITFSERLNLYVGGHTFHLIYQPGHTKAHIGVYIPQEKVFFSGDNFTNGTQPSMAQSEPIEWLKTLKEIEAMDIEAIVPGHGRVGTQEDVREFRLFLQRCVDTMREAIKSGMSKDEIADKISFEDLHPGKQPGLAVHPGSVMQRINVSRLYEMLSK
jgi:cyclase